GFKTAEANYRAARDQVHTLKAQIEQYRAAVELAKKKLNDTVLRAPFAGYVQARHISPGQYLKVQAPAFSIVQTNPLRLRAEVSERFARAIRENQQVKMTMDGAPVTTAGGAPNAASSVRSGDKHAGSFTARISRVSPAVTEQSRTLLVEALVENAQQV